MVRSFTSRMIPGWEMLEVSEISSRCRLWRIRRSLKISPISTSAWCGVPSFERQVTIAGGGKLAMLEYPALMLFGYFAPMASEELCSTSSRSEEHTSELQSLMRISYAVFCLKKNKTIKSSKIHQYQQHK